MGDRSGRASRRAVEVESFRDRVEVYTLADGRQITLLAQGEMLNLAGGGGNPVETMDIGFSLQARSLAYLATTMRTFPTARSLSQPRSTRRSRMRWLDVLTRAQ